MRRLAALAVPFLLLFSASLPAGAMRAGPDPAGLPATDATTEPSDILGRLPLTFVADGADGEIDYRASWGPAAVGFARGGLHLALTDRGGTAQRWGLELAFPGARQVDPSPIDPASGVVSYFIGAPDQWRTGLRTYEGLAYRDLWPGVDLVYSGGRSSLKYEFRVQPGADPDAIGLRWHGGAVARTPVGGLRVATPAGTIVDGAPVAWQPSPDGRIPVDAAWHPQAAGAWGFRVGAMDPRSPLVIDPEILFSGFLGGSSYEDGEAVAVDASGAMYVTGEADDNGAGGSDFPTAVGPDTTYNGTYADVFVAKVAPGGAALVYSGFIGGTESEYPGGIAVDASGAAFVAGETYSSPADGFPVLGGPDLTFAGDEDAFISKVKPDGTGLVYSGYIGGTDYEENTSVAADPSGAAFVAGETYSSQGEGFPVLGGPDVTHNGSTDVFISKVKPDGSGLVYSGYIGGTDYENAAAVAVDSGGAAFVAGETESAQGDGFPVSGGPDLTFNGDQDAFIARVNPSGASLTYSGYIGGADREDLGGVAVDASGAAFLAGDTQSDATTEGFPVAVGPDLSYAGPNSLDTGRDDAFIVKVNPGGGGLAYAGYIGGTDYENGNDVVVDAAGNAYIAGETGSTTADGFPASEGPDTSFNGGDDAFVGRVLPSGGGLGFLSYLGGLKYDYLNGIALDPAGRIFVTGNSNSSEANGFPVKNAFDQTLGGNDDVILASLADVCGGKVATIVGTPGKERLAGTNSADVIVALGGRDKVNGKGGSDRICGDAANDTLKGGGGKDRLYGEGGKDVLLGQAGKDVCVGGPLKDRAKDCEKERQI
jgi:hemolysin type calcium-binding protein/beta-propeller repeat-containing protein